MYKKIAGHFSFNIHRGDGFLPRNGNIALRVAGKGPNRFNG